MHTEKQEKMFALIRQWRDSGITQRRFCDEHQIKLSTFSYWSCRYRRRNDEQAGGFVRLDGAASPPCLPTVEILYPNGVRLSVSGESESVIRRLIHAW